MPGDWNAPTVVGGRGAKLILEGDRELLDMSSLVECSNLGHQHPKLVAAIKAQADKLAFDTASRPRVANSGDFAAIAKLAASVDTLEGFLREMKLRFPDATARAPAADPDPTGSLPQIIGLKRVEAAR